MNYDVDKVRALNDFLRKGEFRESNGCHSYSLWVFSMDTGRRHAVLDAMAEYTNFKAENDPEHKFGRIVMRGEEFHFKIDYYAPGMKQGSEDPGDVTKTRRVLNLTHSSEY